MYLCPVALRGKARYPKSVIVRQLTIAQISGEASEADVRMALDAAPGVTLEDLDMDNGTMRIVVQDPFDESTARACLALVGVEVAP